MESKHIRCPPDKLRVVGISEMTATDNQEEVLVTYSLGSCIGLSLYDPVACVGGLVHCMMPLSKTDPAKARAKPCMYVDSGVMLLLQVLFDLGATRKNLIAKVAGAARMMDHKEIFNIGERNYTVVRRILWKNDILIAGDDTGGTITRSMYLYMATGETTIRTGGKELPL
ncbi:MAG: chemotaxis protein CheD [Kiritimatiellae bacterium]|nr:chemotaxis protein CheD [Kiritimatiellia bacterium]